MDAVVGAVVAVAAAVPVAAAIAQPAVAQANVAQPARQHALLISNHAYQSQIGQPAAGPGNVKALAMALDRSGYTVDILYDAPRASLLDSVVAFAGKLGRNDTFVVYFAGHGASLRNENYLLPVDTQVADGTVSDAAVQVSGISVRRLLKIFSDRQPAARPFFVFDTCRAATFPASAGNFGLVPDERRDGLLLAYAPRGSARAVNGLQGGLAPSKSMAHALIEEFKQGRQMDVTFFQNAHERIASTCAGGVPVVENGLERSTLIGSGELSVKYFCESINRATSLSSLDVARTSIAGLSTTRTGVAGFDTAKMLACVNRRTAELTAPRSVPSGIRGELPSPHETPGLQRAQYSPAAPTIQLGSIAPKPGEFDEKRLPPLNSMVVYASSKSSPTDLSPFAKALSGALAPNADKDVLAVAETVREAAGASFNVGIANNLLPRAKVALDGKSVGGKIAIVVDVDKPTAKDTSGIVASLKSLDFDVTVISGGAKTGERAIRDELSHWKKAKPNSLFVIYYSGHGGSIGGANYVAATDSVTPEPSEGVRRHKGWIGVNDLISTLSESSPQAVVAFIDSVQ